MTDRPILFSGPMVRAILDGRKSQTRRAINPRRKSAIDLFDGSWTDGYVLDPGNQSWREEAYPWRVGDQLYVRETFSGPYGCRRLPPRDWPVGAPIWFWADGDPQDGDWTKPKPGMHMPRWASRLTLTVTDVRVQRLQDISEADAIAEGVPEVMEGNTGDEIYCPRCDGNGVHAALGAGYGITEVDCAECVTAIQRFRNLWDRLNAKRGFGWETNPWVVAVTFSVQRSNIDKVQS